MTEIHFAQPQRINLLGHFLHSLVARNLLDEKGKKTFRRMRGAIGVRASQMAVTLRFDGNVLEIHTGMDAAVDAWVKGDLDTLLGVALGKSKVLPVLRGRLRVGGKIWKLLGLLRLLQVGEPS